MSEPQVFRTSTASAPAEPSPALPSRFWLAKGLSLILIGLVFCSLSTVFITFLI